MNYLYSQYKKNILLIYSYAHEQHELDEVQGNGSTVKQVTVLQVLDSNLINQSYLLLV